MTSLIQSALTISFGIKKLISNEAMSKLENTTYIGDNVNYSIALFQENLIDPNEKNINFLYQLGQTLINWAKKNLYNGYFPMEDAHHGTELFLGFLPRYINLFPEDQEAKSLIVNAAEFIGNWKTDSMDWFDYKTNTFNSWRLGSHGYENKQIYKYDTADHLRFAHIALLAWEITGNTKYLKWATDYSRKFASRIIRSKKNIPVAWGSADKEYYPEDMKTSEEKFLAANHHHLNNDAMSGVENLVASGAIFIFGYLYEFSKEETFYKASKIIVKSLFSIITNPYSDPAAAIISFYRHSFSDYSFDNKILDLSKKIPKYDDSELLLGFAEMKKIKFSGVGNRKDMIYWYSLADKEPQLLLEPPTSFFALLYQISGEINFVERAFNMSARKIKIASSVLRSGHEHADAGRFLSSVISGHGRNWGIGTVTGCYSPLMIGSDESLGISRSIIRFLSSTLSKGVLSLVRKLSNNSIVLNVYNFNDKKIKIKFLNNLNNKHVSLNLDAHTKVKQILN